MGIATQQEQSVRYCYRDLISKSEHNRLKYITLRSLLFYSRRQVIHDKPNTYGVINAMTKRKQRCTRATGMKGWFYLGREVGGREDRDGEYM